MDKDNRENVEDGHKGKESSHYRINEQLLKVSHSKIMN